MFFGTDFGLLDYQRSLEESGGEPTTNPTLRQLKSIIEQAGLSLDQCFLTNALLCMRRAGSATGKFPIWPQHERYVRACAAWHRKGLEDGKPEAIVLMGRPHLQYFGRLLFPELESHWQGLKTMKGVYANSNEAVTLDNGTHVLLMLHPSFWHTYPDEVKSCAIRHLASWSKGCRRHPRR